MELRVTPIQLPEAINFNYDELKAAIEAKASEYAVAVYTKDQISFAKSDRATLRKLKKALNDERIRQEREYMKPFDDFKQKINELMSIIDNPIQLIDKQVKDYEENEKMKKNDDILHFFEGCNFPEWVAFEKIFDAKWLNASVKMSVVEAEIEARLKQINSDLETLSKLPDFSFEATEVYKHTLDLNRAISEGTRLAEMAKRKAQAKAEAEARARAEAEARQAAEMQAVQAPPEQAEETQPEVVISKMKTTTSETVEPKKEWISFKAYMSVEDALALKEFFNSRNIQFTKGN